MPYLQPMELYPIYVGGAWLTTATSWEVMNPHDGSVVATVGVGESRDFEQAIVAAQAAEKELANWSAYQRYEVLMEVATAIRADRHRLAVLLTAESGKPKRFALGEVDRAVQTFTTAAEETKRLPKEYIGLDWTPAGVGKEGVVNYFPIGIVGGITPFNFPLNLVAHKVAPAMAAGCPIIVKPASATPLLCLELAKIIDATNWPKGALSVIPADRTTGNVLVTDPRIKLLSFTGSPTVGWAMKAQAGKKKVVLELGGNAGVIVTESAHLNQAVERCLVGGYAYSGQVCIHAQRIFVQQGVLDVFLSKFLAGVEALQKGDPQEEATEVAEMIDEKNAMRVEAWVNEAREQGAMVLCGGVREGSYYAPTVLTHTNSTMKVNCEEVFGPVVVVEPFHTFEEAITLMNDSDFGLQAGVFTERQDEINTAFRQLEVGGVVINDVPTFRVDHMPYGGIKDSGLGREGVKYAIADMMEPRILVKPT